MSIKKFQRGEIVFKKGQTHVKGIYLIKQGEFEVTKITDIHHPNQEARMAIIGQN